MAGWIKWYRAAELNPVLNDGEPFDRLHAFLWMVESAAPKATTRKGVKLKRGQLWTTYRFMQKAWHWGSLYKVGAFLDELEANKMVRLKKNKKGTLITIEKYKSYQGVPNTNQTGIDTQIDTINKKKEEYSNSEPTSVGVPVAASDNNDPRYRKLELGEPDVL